GRNRSLIRFFATTSKELMTRWYWWLDVWEYRMSKRLSKLAKRYAVGLQKYLAYEQEAVLQQAYDFGRQALALRVGILDLARIHLKSLEKSLWLMLTPHQRSRALKAAEAFFLQCLSPFEATHRGFRETNRQLQQLIKTLEKRNHELIGQISQR